MIVIITARRGSKRCPDKNIMDFCEGLNLVERTIEQARCLKPDAIIVSTDYERDLIHDDDFVYIRREPGLCGDDVSSEAVVRDAIRRLLFGPPRDFCLLQPTSPLRSEETLVRAKEWFQTRKVPALVSLNPAYQPNGSFYFCIWDAFLMDYSLYPIGTAFWMCDWKESVDINYKHEFRIAQAIARGEVHGSL